MPIVPVRAENQQKLDPVTSARFRPVEQGAIGSAIGKGMQQAGQALGDYAVAQDQINATLDEAAAKQADNTVTGYFSELAYTGDNAFFSKKGQDALNARAPTEKAIDDKISETRESLKTDRQRRMFDDVVARRRTEWGTGIARYSAGQADVYNREQTTARVFQAGQDFIRDVDDPEKSAVHMSTILGEIRAQAARDGLQGEPAQVAETKAVSDLYGSVVESKAVADPMAASEWLDQHRDKIAPETQMKLDKMLREPLEEQTADEDANMFRGTVTPGAIDGYRLPVRGTVTSAYGTREHPIDGGKKFHKGMDIGAPEGAPVGSAAAGTVTFAGEKGGYGNYIMVRHADGSETAYAHLSRIGVKVGDKVTSGQLIGAVGSTGNSTGPHLHFELYRDGKPVDPSGAMGARGAQPRNAPRDNDLNSQLAAVDAYAAENGWSFSRVKATKSRLMELARVDATLKKDEEEKAGDAAWAYALDAKNTSIRSIPPAIWANVAPATQRSIMAALKANASGTDATPNPGLYLELSEKAGNGSLTVADVRDAWGKLPKGDWEQVAGWQRSNATAAGKVDQKQVALSRVNTVTKTALEASGITTKGLRTRDTEGRAAVNQRVYNFQKSMLADLEIWQQTNPGKVISDADITAMADRKLLQWNRGSEDSPVFAFEARGPGRISVPTRDVERLKNVARRVLRREPTEEELVQAYLREARGGR